MMASEKEPSSKSKRAESRRKSSSPPNPSFDEYNVSSIKDFIYRELRPTTGRQVDDDSFDENVKAIECDLEHIVNILRVPFQIEQFFTYALLTCLNCFLHFFTTMPMRIAHALFVRRDRLSLQKVRQELLALAMVVFPCVILNYLDTSRIYHRIKGQNAIKLYMIFQVLEMAEKLLSSIGIDLFSILMLRDSVQRSKKEMVILYTTCCLCLTLHALIYIYEMLALNVAVNSYSNSLWTLLLSMQFSELKSAVFKRIDKEGLFQMTIADVVERFQLIIFLMVIAVRNFVVAGKNWSDVLPHSWTVNSTQSLLLGVFIGPIITVIGSELVVDWIKHAYIIKFNRIRAHVYERYLQIISKDMKYNGGIRFQRRLGLPFPPLVASFIVLVWPAVKQTLRNNNKWWVTALMTIIGFIWLLFIKLTLQIILVKWSRHMQKKPFNIQPDHLYINGNLSAGRGSMDEDTRRMIHKSQNNNNTNIYSSSGARQPPTIVTPPGSPELVSVDKLDKRQSNIPPSMEEQRNKRDLKHPKSLETVERYKMSSKRIW